MTPEVRNLFSSPMPQGEGEVFHPLLEGGSFRLESITSRGEASPEGFWYDQPNAEWVLLVRGSARLAFEKREIKDLRAGDYLFIPAHQRHRVESVSEDALWLALHVSGDDLKSDNPSRDAQ
jgi:cupin 2 domain-containing protein